MSIPSYEGPPALRVSLEKPSANRDDAVFDDPDRFDISRPDADKLMSFGVGAHFWVRSSLDASCAPC